ANGLVYRGNLNFNGADTLTVTANDLGNTGSGGPMSDTKTVAITLAAVNDAPVVTVPGPHSGSEDTDPPITGVSVFDVDAGNANIQLMLTVTQGIVTVRTDVVGGITAGQVTGNGTANVVITAPQGAINATLAAVNGLVYRGNLNFNGSDTL